jgi:acyl-coenzyme A thioesterase PaaI-like protein
MDEAQIKSMQSSRIKQPNSKNCFACGLGNEHGLGLQFYEINGDELVAEYVVPEHFEGFPGIVHGGIIASMLDEMVSRAAMIGDTDRFRMTAKLEIRYRAPVPTGQLLKLRAVIEKRRGRISFTKAELRLPDGTVAAEANGMMVDVDDVLIEGANLEELGWKVYPD